jgi:hypothetical protein
VTDKPDRNVDTDGTTHVLSRVDHLVYVVPDLRDGIDEIQELTGNRPVQGGRHADFGTCNALLGLGQDTYLEIIAPDPELPCPARGRPFGVDNRVAPRLSTWALRCEEIEQTASQAAAGSLDLGKVASGRRELPGGAMLEWRLTDPYAHRLDGAVPFLIAWGESPHPATTIPHAGVLVDLVIVHTDPQAVRAALQTLGADANVKQGSRKQLVARIRTAAGELELR